MVYCDKETELDLNLVFETVKNVVGVVNENLTVTLDVVDEDTIHAINKKYRDVDRATDVLSFPLLTNDFTNEGNPFDVDRATGELCLGDIYICDKIARAQAEEYGHSYKREFCYLFVHGLLHLFGFDHIEDVDKVVMRKKEEIVMNTLNITREDAQ